MKYCLSSFRPILIIFLMTSLLIPAIRAKDAEAEKAVISKVIRDSICWALTKDFEAMENSLAHDPDLFYFWINSNFVISGWDEHIKLYDVWKDPRFKATRTEVRDLRIHISRSGDVAWYSAYLDDLGEWDGRPVGENDIQWTGVLEKREGKWVIVQMHASLAADKVMERTKKQSEKAEGSSTPSLSQERKEAMAEARQAALDYIEGWYDGNVERVESVLHPEFVRRIAAITVAGDDFFLHENREDFLARTRRGGDNAVPKEEREIRVIPLNTARTMASVRVDSAYYIEYLSLTKLRGQWKILNILWENVPNDKKEVAIDPLILEAYAGEFQHESGSITQVIVEGGRIFLKSKKEPRTEIFASSETDFFTKGYKSEVIFVRDASGNVIQMIYRANYRDFPMKKIR